MHKLLSYLTVLSVSLWSAHSIAAPALGAVKTLSFPSEKATFISVALPRGTKSVSFGVAGGRMFCKSVRLVGSDASVTGVFGNDDLPDKASETVKTAAQKSFVSVEASCQSKDSTAKLTISAGGGR